MVRSILFISSVAFFSCSNSFHSPTNEEIQQAVINMYEHRNEAAGGGGWKVNDVKVLRSWKGDDERHYNAEVTVKGVHTSPPLAIRRPDEPIDETINVMFTWKGGKWEIADDK